MGVDDAFYTLVREIRKERLQGKKPGKEGKKILSGNRFKCELL